MIRTLRSLGYRVEPAVIQHEEAILDPVTCFLPHVEPPSTVPFSTTNAHKSVGKSKLRPAGTSLRRRHSWVCRSSSDLASNKAPTAAEKINVTEEKNNSRVRSDQIEHLMQLRWRCLAIEPSHR